ncbi:MAG: sigma-70 family RNA polymerase sigma factor [Deltaproteobacteria bacterium]|nr:sigma-70 family RNA polymerase sigma factor [Deltaproteobacteria bacterium]
MGEQAPAVPQEQVARVVGRRDRFQAPSEAVSRRVYAELAADPTNCPIGRELDRAVQRLIYEVVYRQVHALARRSGADLERLVQDAATRALWALPDFDGQSKVSTWTWTICWRTLRDDERSLASVARLVRRAMGFQDEPDSPDPGLQAEHAAQRQSLGRALDRLTLLQRTVVVLYYFEELSIDEISTILSEGGRKVPPKTVQSRLSGARDQLRTLLARDPYFGDIACAQSKETKR